MNQEELDQLKFFVTNAESVLAKREERITKSELTAKDKKAPPMFPSEPLNSHYFDRI